MMKELDRFILGAVIEGYTEKEAGGVPYISDFACRDTKGRKFTIKTFDKYIEEAKLIDLFKSKRG